VPAPKGRRRRGPWVIAAVAAVVVIAVVAVVFSVGGKRHQPIGGGGLPGGYSSTTTTAGSATGTYAPDPLTRLPTAEEIEQVTLLAVHEVGVPYTIAAPDTKATPSNCALADHPTSKSAWGTTQTEAGRLYTDGTYTSYQNTVGVDLAVFSTAAEATQSLTKIADSVTNCVGRYTTPSGQGGAPVASSVISVRQSANAISWAGNTLDQERPWICSMAYRVESNLAASSVICGVNETDSPAKLVELTLNKATGRV